MEDEGNMGVTGKGETGTSRELASTGAGRGRKGEEENDDAEDERATVGEGRGDERGVC